MCIMVENAGYGSAVAAPIAKRILHKFFYPDAQYQTASPEVLDIVNLEEELFEIFNEENVEQ